MKFKFTLFFLIFSLNYLQAGPVGNPAAPSIIQEGLIISDKAFMNLRMGIEFYYVSDEAMRFTKEFKNLDFDLNTMGLYAKSGVITFNFKERLDVYANIGSCKMESSFSRLNNLYKAKSKEDVLYKVGAKLVLLEMGKFVLGADAKYLRFKPKTQYLLQNESVIKKENFKFFLREWQIAIGISRPMTLFSPYLGLTVRNTKAKFKYVPFYHNRVLELKYERREGLYLGTSLSMGSNIFLNGEIRLINERSVVISGDIRF